MERIRHAQVLCALGAVTLVARDDALSGLYFPDHWHPPTAEILGTVVDVDADTIIAQAFRELDEYLAGVRRTFDVSLSAAGDTFSQEVWRKLKGIPYGQTTTYGTLALELGSRNLAQRVGQVVGRNPLCIFIPCHRVVGASGSLTGYAGGLERKRILLELEEPAEAAASRLF